MQDIFLCNTLKRIKSHIVTPDFDAMVEAISDIREWKRPLVSIGALVGWLLFINFFQLWVSDRFFVRILCTDFVRLIFEHSPGTTGFLGFLDTTDY